MLGLRPDSDAEHGVTLAPVRPWGYGTTQVTGLGTHERRVRIEVSDDGRAVTG